MARRRPRPRPTRVQTLTPVATRCPECQHPLWADYTNYRTVTTLDAVTRLTFCTGLVNLFVSRGVGTRIAAHFLAAPGMRSANMIAKWFKAAFQPTIGIVHFLDASWIAM